LREGVAHLPLGEDLVVADLVVASDHVLGAADDFVLENIETLLKEVKFAGDCRFFLCELRVFVDFLLDTVFNFAFDLV
jgi:hypothetical protein